MRGSYKIYGVIKNYIKESTKVKSGFNTSTDLVKEIWEVFHTKISPAYVRRIRSGFSNENFLLIFGRFFSSLIFSSRIFMYIFKIYLG